MTAVIITSSLGLFGCGESPVANTNHAPVVVSITADPFKIAKSESTILTCLATDSDGNALSYSWWQDGSLLSGKTTSRESWTAPATAGNRTIKVIVSDGTLTAEGTLVINVLENHAPVIRSLIATPANILAGSTSVFSCEATDADGDAITYSWSASSGSFSGSGTNIKTWTAPATDGSYTITVSANDGHDTTDASMTVFVYSVAATTVPVAPAAPTVTRTRTSAQIVWGNVSGATIYKLSYGIDSDAASFFTITTSPFVINDLTPGTFYFVKIASENSAGTGSDSDITVFQTLP